MMNGQITYLQTKKIDDVFDVVVVGGGLAGVMGAISAAREGRKVLLVEQYGCLGGMATSGMIFPFMRDCEKGSERRVNAGLYLTMLGKVYELGGSASPTSKSYRDEFMKIVLDRMVRDAGVKVLFHTRLCDVEMQDGRVRSVTAITPSGMVRLYGKVFMDATGNAELCAFAGLPYQMGREEDGMCQPMTLCFRLANVDRGRLDMAEANRVYKQMKAEGKLRNPREDILSMLHPAEGVLHMNTTRAIVSDPTDVEQVSLAEAELREQMLEMYHFMREYVPGMENCELIASPIMAGIRESRRIVGLTQITADDLMNTRKFEDSIARGAYAIDIHNPVGSGTDYRRIPEGDYYTVPYRALVPEHTANLIVAGRAISATHEALAAVRIMPITSCMGEAAGIAAAMAAEEQTAMADVNVARLREKLIAYGALV